MKYSPHPAVQFKASSHHVPAYEGVSYKDLPEEIKEKRAMIWENNSDLVGPVEKSLPDLGNKGQLELIKAANNLISKMKREGYLSHYEADFFKNDVNIFAALQEKEATFLMQIREAGTYLYQLGFSSNQNNWAQGMLDANRSDERIYEERGPIIEGSARPKYFSVTLTEKNGVPNVSIKDVGFKKACDLVKEAKTRISNHCTSPNIDLQQKMLKDQLIEQSIPQTGIETVAVLDKSNGNRPVCTVFVTKRRDEKYGQLKNQLNIETPELPEGKKTAYLNYAINCTFAAAYETGFPEKFSVWTKTSNMTINGVNADKALEKALKEDKKWFKENALSDASEAIEIVIKESKNLENKGLGL